MTDLFVVWDPPSLVSAIVGGLLVGVLLARVANPNFDAVESGVLAFLMGAIAGAAFWSGQAVSTFNAPDGDVLGWRVVSRFGEWILFSASIAVGLSISLRFIRGGWRL